MDFYGQSAASYVTEYKNLLVVKTFSKSYSLAGIRCGYAVGDKSLIDGLFRVKDCYNSYPVDRVCAEVCSAAIQAKEYYRKATGKVQTERTRVTEELRKMGFYVPESGANFVFAGNENLGGEYVYRSLRERGVLVRFWNKPELKNFVRITIGSKEQNDVLLAALREIVK